MSSESRIPSLEPRKDDTGPQGAQENADYIESPTSWAGSSPGGRASAASKRRSANHSRGFGSRDFGAGMDFGLRTKTQPSRRRATVDSTDISLGQTIELAVPAMLMMLKAHEDRVEMVQCLSSVLVLRDKELKLRDTLDGDLRRTKAELQTSGQNLAAVTQRLEASQREAGGLMIKNQQLEDQLKSVTSVNKKETTDWTKAKKDLERRHVQFQHEIRRKERDFEELQDRLRRYLQDRKKEKEQADAATMEVMGALAKGGRNRKPDEEMYKMVLKSYTEKQHELARENMDLRAALQDLEKAHVQAVNDLTAVRAGHGHGMHGFVGGAMGTIEEEDLAKPLPVLAQEKKNAEQQLSNLKAQLKKLQDENEELEADYTDLAGHVSKETVLLPRSSRAQNILSMAGVLPASANGLIADDATFAAGGGSGGAQGVARAGEAVPSEEMVAMAESMSWDELRFEVRKRLARAQLKAASFQKSAANIQIDPSSAVERRLHRDLVNANTVMTEHDQLVQLVVAAMDNSLQDHKDAVDRAQQAEQRSTDLQARVEAEVAAAAEEVSKMAQEAAQQEDVVRRQAGTIQELKEKIVVLTKTEEEKALAEQQLSKMNEQLQTLELSVQEVKEEKQAAEQKREEVEAMVVDMKLTLQSQQQEHDVLTTAIKRETEQLTVIKKRVEELEESEKKLLEERNQLLGDNDLLRRLKDAAEEEADTIASSARQHRMRLLTTSKRIRDTAEEVAKQKQDIEVEQLAFKESVQKWAPGWGAGTFLHSNISTKVEERKQVLAHDDAVRQKVVEQTKWKQDLDAAMTEIEQAEFSERTVRGEGTDAAGSSASQLAVLDGQDGAADGGSASAAPESESAEAAADGAVLAVPQEPSAAAAEGAGPAPEEGEGSADQPSDGVLNTIPEGA